jgi:hypothetical protein
MLMSLYPTAVEEAKIRLKLAMELTGRGDDLPSEIYASLIVYREKLKDYLDDPKNTPNPFNPLFHRGEQ